MLTACFRISTAIASMLFAFQALADSDDFLRCEETTSFYRVGCKLIESTTIAEPANDITGSILETTYAVHYDFAQGCTLSRKPQEVALALYLVTGEEKKPIPYGTAGVLHVTGRADLRVVDEYPERLRMWPFSPATCGLRITSVESLPSDALLGQWHQQSIDQATIIEARLQNLRTMLALRTTVQWDNRQFRQMATVLESTIDLAFQKALGDDSVRTRDVVDAQGLPLPAASLPEGYARATQINSELVQLVHLYAACVASAEGRPNPFPDLSPSGATAIRLQLTQARQQLLDAVERGQHFIDRARHFKTILHDGLREQIAASFDLMSDMKVRFSDDGQGQLQGRSITATRDGNVVVAGSGLSPFGRGVDMMIAKLDREGREIWRYYFGGEGWDGAASVRETSDGGLLVAGTKYTASGSVAHVLRLDSEARTLWQYDFGSTGHNWGVDAIELTTGDFVFVGNLLSSGTQTGVDIYLQQIDRNGNIGWARKILGPTEDNATQALALPNGGFVVAGFKGAMESPKQGFLTICDSAGASILSRHIGREDKYSAFFSLAPTPGGFAAAGAVDLDDFGASSSGAAFAGIYALDGTVFSERRIATDRPMALHAVASDGGNALWVAGETFAADGNKHATLLRLDPNMNITWTRDMASPASSRWTGMVPLADQTLALTGWGPGVTNPHVTLRLGFLNPAGLKR